MAPSSGTASLLTLATALLSASSCCAWSMVSSSPAFSISQASFSMNVLRQVHVAKYALASPYGRQPAPSTTRSFRNRCSTLLSMSTTEQQPQLWEELFDEDTGSPYYWNKLTGETQWEKPALDEALETQDTGFASTDDYAEIEECSKFFVDAFWAQGTTLGNLDLTPKQKSALLEEQKRDMDNRYGRLLGSRKLSSSLILSRDESGAIVGCVGVEISVADKNAFSILSRDAGEQLLNGGLAALGGRQRNLLRKAPLTELASAVLPQDKGLIPVLSNLAVSPTQRGQGLGRALCAEAEMQARQWGFAELLLLVEAANAPARKLYSSLGYQEMKTAAVKTVRIGADGIESEMIETVTMAKQL